MARRTEKVKARASARLLEEDLRSIRSLYRRVGGVKDPPDSPGRVKREKREASAEERAWAEDTLRTRVPLALDSWQSHRPLLAETLDNEDWYSLTEAYSWLQTYQLVDSEVILVVILESPRLCFDLLMRV